MVIQGPLFASDCENVTLSLRPIVYKCDKTRVAQEVDELKRRGFSDSQAKGITGEMLARRTIENNVEFGNRSDPVSICTLFARKGCQVEGLVKDNADRGIDDIFVFPRKDGWINRNESPVFHEAKYSSGCNVKLSKTETMCDQLSVQWLDRNLKIVSSRTSKAYVCFGDRNVRILTSCEDCIEQFQEAVQWLQDMLRKRSFSRTVSVLCEDGTLRIYNAH